MLMTGGGTPARVHYMAGAFRVLSNGDHVVCAVTGARIPLHELKYWSVERQEPYVDAEASLKPSGARGIFNAFRVILPCRADGANQSRARRHRLCCLWFPLP
jgi:hypothetical protein